MSFEEMTESLDHLSFVLRSFDYHLYPTKKQEARLFIQFQICTELYDFPRSQCKQACKQSGKYLTRFDLNKKTKEKKRRDIRFKIVYSKVLQNQENV